MAKSSMDTNQFMCEPITPMKTLNDNPDDIKTKMELMIMRIQADFCKALEAEEDKVSLSKLIV